MYTPEEAARLCKDCGGLVIHPVTHEQGDRHRRAVAALQVAVASTPAVAQPAAGRPSPEDAVAAALAVLRAFRPDLLPRTEEPAAPADASTPALLPRPVVANSPVTPPARAQDPAPGFDQELMDFLGAPPASGP